MYFILPFLVSNIYCGLCIKSVPGRPVPNAQILDEILTAHINDSYYNSDSIVEYILGNITNPASAAENLAVNVLDVDNVKKIIGNARRQFSYLKPKYRDAMAYGNNSIVCNKSIELMLQSIYQTRYRIKRTKPIRDAYSTDISFNIAVLYGAARQIVMQMDNLYGQLKKLPYTTHFIWFLVLYEKLLAHNVDVTDMTRRIFKLHEEYVAKFADYLGDDAEDLSKEEDIKHAMGKK